jgi:hypothetical protein
VIQTSVAVSRGAVIWALVGVAAIGGSVAVLKYQDRRAREPFDADRYLASGMADAVREANNVQLRSIEITFVSPDGKVHTEHAGHLRMSWVGDGDAPTEAAIPGAPHRGSKACTDISLRVMLSSDSDGIVLEDDIRTNRNTGCYGTALAGPLRCTVAKLWQRAIAKGAPNPATIRLDTAAAAPPELPARRIWTFEIVDNVTDGPSKKLFAATFDDDC